MADSEPLRKVNSLWKGLLHFIILCSLSLIFTYSASARDDITRKGVFLNLGFGFGVVDFKLNNKDVSCDTAPVGIQVGYAITPNIIFGLEGNTSIIQAYNGGYETHSTARWYDYIFFDPWGEDYDRFHTTEYHPSTKGESINNYALFASVFPFHKIPFYIKGGGGKTVYNIIINDKKFDDNGWAWFLGCGYEFPFMKVLTWGPEFMYDKGNFSKSDYSGIKISITFHGYIH